MNIRHATSNDAAAWNRYIENRPDASVYHNFAWKQAIEDAYGMEGHYLIAENDQNQIAGVLPIIQVRAPFSAGKLSSLPYCDRGEALANDNSTIDLLIEHARKLANDKDIKVFEYRDTQKNNAINIEDLSPKQKVRMVLDLPKTSDALLKSFKAKLRSQINKATKNGLTAELSNSPEMVDAFYSIFTQNMRDLGSPTHSRQWFQAVSNHFGKKCVISIVDYQGRAIGAGLILIQGQTAFIPWASTLRIYNRLAPNMLLYWSLLQYSVDHACSAFDFGRSTYGEGTFKFKQQWGAKPVPLKWSLYDLHNNRVLEDKPANKSPFREVMESAWRHLPLPVTIQAGSLLRRYISL